MSALRDDQLYIEQALRAVQVCTARPQGKAPFEKEARRPAPFAARDLGNNDHCVDVDAPYNQ